MSVVLLDEHSDCETRPSLFVPTQRGPRAKLRAGVVGLGRQAVEDHIPALKSSDVAELVAVCDDDAKVLQDHRSLNVPAYQDFHHMLTAERLDFVIVTVPHSVGAAVVEAAADRRVHVLKEKPSLPAYRRHSVSRRDVLRLVSRSW